LDNENEGNVSEESSAKMTTSTNDSESSTVAATVTASEQEPTKEIPKPEPPFTVPLKELDVGKAGVSDLFKKQNEVIKYLNALSQKPKVP